MTAPVPQVAVIRDRLAVAEQSLPRNPGWFYDNGLAALLAALSEVVDLAEAASGPGGVGSVAAWRLTAAMSDALSPFDAPPGISS